MRSMASYLKFVKDVNMWLFYSRVWYRLSLPVTQELFLENLQQNKMQEHSIQIRFARQSSLEV